jgi:hypothetical protein
MEMLLNMNNQTKYELIVCLKELIKDTERTSIEKFNDNMIFSLNASKLMKLIYSNDALESFFAQKVEKYTELKQDKEKYNIALAKRKEQLETLIDTRLLLENTRFWDFTEFITNDFIFELILNFRLDVNFTNGIFQFIHGFFGNNKSYEYMEDDYINRLCLLFNDPKNFPYYADLADTYDYYYLFIYEIYQYPSLFYPHMNLFFYIAYRKVIRDLLEHLYTMNLSKQEIEQRKQKQEQFLKNQKREQFISKLTDAEKELFEFIEGNPDLSAKEIARIKKKSENTIKKQIRNIMENANEKKGGLKALKKLIRLFS